MLKPIFSNEQVNRTNLHSAWVKSQLSDMHCSRVLDQAQLPCSRTHSEWAAKAEETCLKSCPVIKRPLTSTQFLTRYLYLDLHLSVASPYNFHRKGRKAQLEKPEKNSSGNLYFNKHQGFHIKENLINAFQQERIQLDALTLSTKWINLSPKSLGKWALLVPLLTDTRSIFNALWVTS